MQQVCGWNEKKMYLYERIFYILTWKNKEENSVGCLLNGRIKAMRYKRKFSF